jgi:hypothetical protein
VSVASVPAPSSNPNDWDTAAVCDWVHAIGLGAYSENFRNERVTGEFLVRFCDDREIMENLGVRVKLHQKRMFFELSKLAAVVAEHNGSASKKSTASRKRGASANGEEPKPRKPKSDLPNLPPILFGVSKSAKARCKICQSCMEQGTLKVGSVAFFRSARGTFPVRGIFTICFCIWLLTVLSICIAGSALVSFLLRCISHSRFPECRSHEWRKRQYVRQLIES